MGFPHGSPCVVRAWDPTSVDRNLNERYRQMRHRFLDLPPDAKCTRCRGTATIRMPGHHANFCAECFILFFERAVSRAMDLFRLSAAVPVMVAVSGGKDSLALWDVLHGLGYMTRGLHLDLGIDGFSQVSSDAVESFAAQRGLPLATYSLKDVFGYTLPQIRHGTRRKICGVCGFLKRQLLNRLTIREGFRTLALGHNLDDEAGRLLGNIVRHRSQYFEKQYPLLPSNHQQIPTKLKPLYRVDAREITIYCRIKGIKPTEVPCPLSRGATSHMFKEALDLLESKMPGTKRDFLFSYLDRRHPPGADSDFAVCRGCGEPAYEDVCSVCNLRSRLEEVDPDKPQNGIC